ncbi:MAG: PilZ domain-containing protein [Myxococcaceae bacterium]|nr:PilZ domain-containing protein [Myxococcaceae bacterium]MCI0672530.1 PilZ domain-containing protein [Myxococcaceae bacterium]
MAKRVVGSTVRSVQQKRLEEAPGEAQEALRGGPSANPVFRSATGGFTGAASRTEGTPAPAGVVPLDERDNDGPEHRQFPRARVQVRVEAWVDHEQERRFSASFLTDNLSVSGAFLESTFFLPVGTALRIRFDLDTGEAPVEARAVIIREERSEERSGFGIRFEEFYGQSEVSLAKRFLVTQLRTFATEYLRSPRAGTLTSELDRMVDALAAWELLKVTQPRDTWRGG